MMMTLIRIAIVDSHDIVREGLKLFFASTPDIVCIGEADKVQAAFELCQQTEPHILLVDYAHQQEAWGDLLEPLCQAYPAVQVLALTSDIEPDLIQTTLRPGVNGYLLKMTDGAALEQAIRAVSQRQPTMDGDATLLA